MSKLMLEQVLLINLPNELSGYPWTMEKKYVMENVDWKVLLYLAKFHKLFPMVYKVLQQYIPDKYIRTYDREFNSFKEGINNSLSELKELSLKAEEHNVDFILNKGFGFSKIIYDDEFLRMSGDIDILVKEPDMMKMDALLRKSGYLQVYYDGYRNKNIIISLPVFKRTGHHEFYGYLKEVDNKNTVSVEVSRYLHSFDGSLMKTFFENTRKVSIGDFEVKSFDILHIFLALCENAYNNSEALDGVTGKEINLRDYIDIYTFIKKYINTIDWVEAANTARKCNMLHQVFRILANLERIYDASVPDEILQLFDIKHLDYEFTGFENGSLVKWESDFPDRVFDRDNNLKEFLKCLKAVFYSDRNDNYKNPLKINSFSQSAVDSPKDYIDLNNEKYSFCIKYLPLYDNENLYFSFYLDDTIYKHLEHFVIELRIIDHNEDKSTFATLSYVTRRDDFTVYSLFNTEKFIYSSREIRNAKYFSESEYRVENIISVDKYVNFLIKIPCSYLGVDKIEPCKKLCYQIFLLEKVYEQLYHIIGSNDKTLLKPEVIQTGI